MLWQLKTETGFSPAIAGQWKKKDKKVEFRKLTGRNSIRKNGVS